MKYFKYGLFSVSSNPLFNIIIMLEIAAMLIVANMAIATANSREVLNEPYAELMEHEGYIYQCKKLKDPAVDRELVIKNLMDSLKGDLSFTYCYTSQIKTDKSVLKGSPLSKEEVRNIYTFDEKVYSKFNLPLADGRWASAQRNEKNQIEAVAVVGTDDYLKVGDVIKADYSDLDEQNNIVYVDIGEVVIVGTITDNYYFPNVYANGSNKMNIQNLYMTGNEYTGNAVFLVSSAADEHFSDPRDIATNFTFITYNSEPTDEIREFNLSQLSTVKGTIVNISDFKARSDEFLYEQYIRLLPLLLCVFIIVVTGLICSVSMNTYSQLCNYGIYFLCGCRWKGCLKISLAYSAIILTGGAILGTIAFLLFQLSDYAKLFEQNLALNNIYITLAVILIMLLIS
ncbi:MAG: hypothetical protein IJ861_08850, partial [Clostridia bacterium]|nr:hypothetical protein [Clostridia bacterium]